MATALASIPHAAQKEGAPSYSFGAGVGIFGGQHAYAAGVSTAVLGISLKAGLALDGDFGETSIGLGAAFHF